ncbi:FHA domain-containing protein [Steroidobacter sp.]|uniref:FHA domain-containing protein n=1 Tax=Steroidobacter sp. TaxID=1978227 RepID=UPI001A4ED47B|nr:FHA domain-containing protein [Steroidobacter sp.]MBL8270470.1 FHA domain-containing protein [Steroidobacter sp.]
MSTQIDTPIMDLDRTDELPVLDVAAYEASLAGNEKNLSRTDAWAVQGLRAVDDLNRDDLDGDELEADELDADSDDEVAPPTVTKPNAQAEALTINVERILGRFAELEAEVAATHESNALLQNDCEALRAEQAQAELRMEALQADNARLYEDRAELNEVARLREQQLSERAEAIAALEKTVSKEKDVASRLSRQLAVKLMACEQAVSTVTLRDRTIEDLKRDVVDLSQRLEQGVAASAELTTQLAAAEQKLHDEHALLLANNEVGEQKDAQLAQTHAQIQSLTEERDVLRSAATELEERTADLESRNAELAQLHHELVAARAEEQSQRQLLKERTEELGKLRSTLSEQEAAARGFEQTIRAGSDQIKELMAELVTARSERSTVDAQLVNARVRTKNLTDQIFTRDNRIAALEADLAVHVEALATIKRDVNRIGQREDDAESDGVEHMLEPVGHDGPTFYLTGEVLSVGRTSENDICIPSKMVSRCHARLLVGPTGVIIEDVKSTNGCYVNGEHVRKYLLQDGDVLELGDMRYRLRTRAVRSSLVKHDTNVRKLSLAPRKNPTQTMN